MITKEEMLQPILEASQDFVPVWNSFLDEWKETEKLPLYLLFSSLARHITSLISQNKEDELIEIFHIIEQWIVDGDRYVKEAAIVGVLEDLQNTNIVGNEIPKRIEDYLLPESKRWWIKLYGFWEEGKPLND